jgi:hypothetical protein
MIVIQIVDWRSYVVRPGVKKPSAFKLSTGLFTPPKLNQLTMEARWLWVILLSLATQENKDGTVEQTLDCLEFYSGVNRKTLGPALQELKSIGIIEICAESVHACTQSAQTCAQPAHKRTRQKTNKTEVIDLTDEELELGRKWLEMAVSEMPHRESDPKWHAAEFGTELKKVGQAVGLDHAGMLKVFHYVSGDTFWRPNACSPKGLLVVNKNGVRKIDNILTRMKKPAERLADIREEQRADTTRPLNEDGVTIEDVHYWFRNK